MDGEKLGELIFPFNAVVPDITKECFTVYATSCGSTRDLILISVLMSTSPSSGKTTLHSQHHGSSFEKLGHGLSMLIMISLTESGSRIRKKWRDIWRRWRNCQSSSSRELAERSA